MGSVGCWLGPITVICADAALPFPASVEVTALVTLFCAPAVVPKTFTAKEQEAAADRLLPVLRQAGAEGCYVYAFDEKTARAYARFFNPTMGLWEDVATGTAAGPLSAYLAREGLLTGTSLIVEQGTRMGRRSILSLTLTPDPELSGSGVITLQGKLKL